MLPASRLERLISYELYGKNRKKRFLVNLLCAFVPKKKNRRLIRNYFGFGPFPNPKPVELYEAGYLNKAVELLETDAAYRKKSCKEWLTLAACKLAQRKYQEAGSALNMAMAFALNGLLETEIGFAFAGFFLATGQIKTGINFSRYFYIRVKACPVLYPLKLWDGISDLNNKTIGVTANYDWGLGDQLHFGRYLKLLKMRYPRARICLLGSKALERLFLENKVADAYYDPAEKRSEPVRLPALDYTADLLLLGAILAEDYQRQEPIVYLKAGNDVSQELQSSLRNHPACQARVAFANKGAPRPFFVRKRDVNLEYFKAIFLQNPQIHFYACSKETQDSDFTGLDNVTNLGPLLSDLYDTAFVLERMDTVISVETSLAALASAMGKEVHLISNTDTCWRFHEYQGRSLWFDNFIPYRHEGEPQWPKILEQIGRHLRERFPPKET